MHIAAAEWILRLPEGRAAELLDAGCKAVLIVLWSHTKWKREQDATCEECYPSAPTIADATGSSLKATRKRLARLVAARWARHEKRANGEWGWALAWREPFPLQGDTPPVPAMPLQGPRATPPGSKGCPSRVTKQETNEEIEPSREQDSASKPAPDVPASTPRKSRTRKPIELAGQTALGIPDAPMPDAVAELLAEHERLRRVAQAHHGQRPTALPGPGSKSGRALRDRLSVAVNVHGAHICRRIIVHRGLEWFADIGQLAWSVEQPWSPKSIEHTLRAIGAAPARASPSAGTLPLPTDPPKRDFVFPWNPTP